MQNIDGLKHFLSPLLRALKEERHFALVEGFAFPTVGSLVIVFKSGTQSDPCISSVATAIMITTSLSLLLPSFNKALRRGSQTSTRATWG